MLRAQNDSITLSDPCPDWYVLRSGSARAFVEKHRDWLDSTATVEFEDGTAITKITRSAAHGIIHALQHACSRDTLVACFPRDWTLDGYALSNTSVEKIFERIMRETCSGEEIAHAPGSLDLLIRSRETLLRRNRLDSATPMIALSDWVRIADEDTTALRMYRRGSDHPRPAAGRPAPARATPRVTRSRPAAMPARVEEVEEPEQAGSEAEAEQGVPAVLPTSAKFLSSLRIEDFVAVASSPLLPLQALGQLHLLLGDVSNAALLRASVAKYMPFENPDDAMVARALPAFLEGWLGRICSLRAGVARVAFCHAVDDAGLPFVDVYLRLDALSAF